MDFRASAFVLPQLLLLMGGVILFSLWASPVAAQASVSDPGADTLAYASNSLSQAFETVDELRSQRRFRDAIELLHRLQNEHPGNANVLYRLAFTWSDMGKAADGKRQSEDFYRHALAAAQKALAADSTCAWAHFAMAVAQGRLSFHAGTRVRIERSRAVKEHAERAVDLDSTLAGAYHVRGRWHREAADLNFIQRAIVATIYGGLPEASFDQAVNDFQTAIALETRAYHHLELGKTYREMGRIDAAKEQLRTALEVPPSDPFAPEYKREARQLLRDLN